MRLCYISRNYPNSGVAGFKAKQDSEDTIALMGGENLGLKRTFVKSKVAGFVLNLAGITKATMRLRKGDVLFLQYPLRKYFKYLCRLARRKGAKTIVLVHDFRCYHHVELPETVDTDSLRLADYVIVGTEAMADWLRQRGINSVGVLGLWDFRSDAVRPQDTPTSSAAGSPVIVYAGSIRRRKTLFLEELAKRDLPYDIHLYGHLNDMADLRQAKHIKVNPFMDSDAFIATVKGDFGLVWDSNSVTGSTGYYGVYQGLCLSHKTSFYLRAGLPVIVWSGSAVAPVLRREGIGLTVDSLEELPELLSRVTDEEMAAMRRNVERVGALIADGHYVRTAVSRAVETLSAKP